MKTRDYLAEFGTLIALTVVTAAAAKLHLEPAVAILIAAAKASLVGLFFMHPRHERRLTYFVALFPLLLVAILILLVLPDFLSTWP